jgi:hypothetical protein
MNIQLIVHQILKGIVEAQMNLQAMGIESASTIFTKMTYTTDCRPTGK